MYFKQVHIGGYDSNLSYLIGDENTKEVAVVDPDNLPLLNQIIQSDGLEIVAILLTHGHFDHTVGCEEMQKQSAAKIYLHEKNTKLEDLLPENCQIVKNDDQIQIGELKIKVVETPGHTPGSVCYYVDGKLITGDTLFIGGCGRCDLAGGNPQQMYNSLFNVIGKLPDTTEIYPGHDYGRAPHASLVEEKLNNRFYLCNSEEEFLRERMGY